MKANGHPHTAPPPVMPTKPKRRKPAPTNGHAGTWHAVANHTGKSVPVPGLARDQGYQAKLQGAELLSVKPEHVLVSWVADEKAMAK